MVAGTKGGDGGDREKEDPGSKRLPPAPRPGAPTKPPCGLEPRANTGAPHPGEDTSLKAAKGGEGEEKRREEEEPP